MVTVFKRIVLMFLILIIIGFRVEIVLASPHITISHDTSHDEDAIPVGSIVTFTWNVTNDGTENIQNITYVSFFNSTVFDMVQANPPYIYLDNFSIPEALIVFWDTTDTLMINNSQTVDLQLKALVPAVTFVGFEAEYNYILYPPEGEVVIDDIYPLTITQQLTVGGSIFPTPLQNFTLYISLLLVATGIMVRNRIQVREC